MPGAGHENTFQGNLHAEYPWKATYGAWPLAHPFRDTESNLCSNTPRDPEGVGGLFDIGFSVAILAQVIAIHASSIGWPCKPSFTISPIDGSVAKVKRL